MITIVMMLALFISTLVHIQSARYTAALLDEKREDRRYYKRLLGWKLEEDHWDDFVNVWRDIGLWYAATCGDHRAALMIQMEAEAVRRGGDAEWIDVYADLAHWMRFVREWHFIGCQYAMEATLAQVRADVSRPQSMHMHPVIGVETTIQRLHAMGFVSDAGAQRAGGRLPS